ncbi:hypothetical protein P4N68_09085 [Corynebacterium felinum]|uniref:Tetratricopeptide repeat protein n=1 Tax=Corynebacterium felinum TaxID=131318 RepID=A0ABU2B584_9CORY|nr:MULTISPECIES: hypothetical protein [Corynebacterium]MDF5821227.1 hypothetical protein [Corynebacterium felinum]MDO4761031.1 hypothetical protein [Corynebacterium sp.]MDR7353772.1 hypothetical protein [Corynebacterium felinum]WJY95951.1 hypothetical protein CFELI_11845 [Corynebacterium felinum]
MQDSSYSLEDFESLMLQAEAEEFSYQRVLLHEEALGVARSLGDEDAVAYSMAQLCLAYAYSGMLYRLPELFDETLAFIEGHLHLESRPMVIEILGCCFKFVLLAETDHPATPVSALVARLEQLREFMVEQDGCMQEYYLRSFYAYRDFGDFQLAADAFAAWQVEPKEGRFSECPSCLPIHEIRELSYQGRFAEAAELGEQVLARPEEFCQSQPLNLHMSLLQAWVHLGEISLAKKRHRVLLLSALIDPLGGEFLPDHYRFFADFADAKQDRGLRLGRAFFASNIKHWAQVETPRILMETAACAARMLYRVGSSGRRMRKVRFEGDCLPWGSMPDLMEPTVREAAQWCEELALQLAQRFDARPGLVQPHTVADIQALIRS